MSLKEEKSEKIKILVLCSDNDMFPCGEFRPQLTAGSWPPDLLRDNTTDHESFIRVSEESVGRYFTSLKEI